MYNKKDVLNALKEYVRSLDFDIKTTTNAPSIKEVLENVRAELKNIISNFKN